MKIKENNTADCYEKNLHCFKSNTRTLKNGIERGNCIYCNAALVDWARVHKRNLNDVQYTIDCMLLAKNKYYYWKEEEFTTKRIEQLSKLSDSELYDKIKHRLEKSVAKPKSEIYRDGMQTANDDNPIHLAQHAIGACCRKCILIWHDIDVEQYLTEENFDYLTRLMQIYIYQKSVI